MGLRFRKRIGIGPFGLNLSRRGVGYSVGVPGARVTKSAAGKNYLTFGIPGTGLSWSKDLGNRRSIDPGQEAADVIEPTEGIAAPVTDEDSRPPAPLEFD